MPHWIKFDKDKAMLAFRSSSKRKRLDRFLVVGQGVGDSFSVKRCLEEKRFSLMNLSLAPADFLSRKQPFNWPPWSLSISLPKRTTASLSDNIIRVCSKSVQSVRSKWRVWSSVTNTLTTTVGQPTRSYPWLWCKLVHNSTDELLAIEKIANRQNWRRRCCAFAWILLATDWPFTLSNLRSTGSYFVKVNR